MSERIKSILDCVQAHDCMACDNDWEILHTCKLTDPSYRAYHIDAHATVPDLTDFID